MALLTDFKNTWVFFWVPDDSDKRVVIKERTNAAQGKRLG